MHANDTDLYPTDNSPLAFAIDLVAATLGFVVKVGIIAVAYVALTALIGW